MPKRMYGFYVSGVLSLMWCYYLFSPPYSIATKEANEQPVSSRPDTAFAASDTAFVADGRRTMPRVYGTGKPDIVRFLDLWDTVMPEKQKKVYSRFNIAPQLRMEGFHDTALSLLQPEIQKFGPEMKQQFSFFNRSYEQRLPDAIVIGCRKCGSTFLKETLELHPNIAVALNEIHFFNKHSEYRKGFDYYKTQMPPSFSDQITVEKSPSYFVNVDTPERVYALNPNIKLVLVVRDPACRTISDYYYGIRKGYYTPEVGESLDDVIARSAEDPLKQSLTAYSSYYSCMLRWLQYFPLKSFHIVRNEDLMLAPRLKSALYNLESFLGVPHVFNVTKPYVGRLCIRGGAHLPKECFNSEGEGCKYRRTHAEPMKQFTDMFRQEAEQFQNLVQRNFSWYK